MKKTVLEVEQFSSVWPDCDSWPWTIGWRSNLQVGYRVGRGGGYAVGICDLLFCENCCEVLTRHPKDVLDELDSYYCPQSLDNLPSSEATMTYSNRSSRFFECPVCTAVLSTLLTSAKGLASVLEKPVETMADDQDMLYYLGCGHCRWDSLDVGLFASSPEELILLGLNKEKEGQSNLPQLLIQRYKNLEKRLDGPAGVVLHGRGGPSNISSPPLKFNKLLKLQGGMADDDDDDDDDDDEEEVSGAPWRWDVAEAHFQKKWSSIKEVETLEVPEEVREVHAKLSKQMEEPDLPVRLSLRTKKSIRCRSCMKANLPNILIKSQINPLKGDSSMRTNVGAWFKKKSLAYDHLPRIVGKYDDESKRVLLNVTNPRESKAILTMKIEHLNREVKIGLDPYDEIEELDMKNANKPPKPGQPRDDDDPVIVRGRLFNKVFLKMKPSSEGFQEPFTIGATYQVEDEKPIEFFLDIFPLPVEEEEEDDDDDEQEEEE